MGDPKGDAAARQAAADAVRDAPAGTRAGAQTEGEINDPHSGHNDSWSATKNADGSVTTSKEHT